INSTESIYQKIRAIHINNTDDIWFGANYNALSNFVQDTIHKYRFSNGDKELTLSSFIRDIAAEKNGNLWIGTTRDGLVYYNRETGNFTYARSNNDKITGIDNSSVNKVFVDKSETIWVGTNKTGLFKSKQSYSFYNYETIINPDDSSTNDYVVDIRECSDGNIVLGLDGNGIAFFEPETETFKFFKNQNNDLHSLSSDHVNSIHVDDDSIIWIGTSLGLNSFNTRTQKFHNYKPNPGMTQFDWSNNVSNIFKSSDGCLWISTYDGFLYLFERQNLKYSSKYYYNSDIVYSDFTNYTKYKEVISCITEDQTGILWIGTVNSGIGTFDLITRKFLNNYLLLSDITETINPIKDILVDSDNNIWVGTPGQGLFKYDRFTDNFINYKDIEGLISNHITTILEDSLHNLWLGTNAGIILFDRFAQSFTPFDIEENIKFYDLSMCDGLQKRLIKGTISYGKYPISNSKGIVTKTGEIYFGGPNGFTRFDPQLISDINPSPMIMTDFKIFDESQCFDKQINEIKELNLTYQDYIFTFVFTLTDYNNPVKNRYAYWLEGFEKNWNYSGSDNKVTYFNIPPGKYILKAKGCNSSGIWNTNPLAIKINISPPFWKTWWFRILMFLSTAGIIGFIVWQRISGIQRQKVELENMVKQRTMELNGSNVQLKEEVKFRKKAESEARKSEEEYRDLFENAYDVIWTSKLDGTILTINRFFRELLGYNINDIIGTNLIDYITPEHRFRAIRNYLKFQKSQFVECELDILSKSKEIRKLWVKVSGIIDNDKMVGIHGIGRDVTELKKAQDELREAEHFKRESIKQLTLKLAHEIKNPLTSITSSAQLVASSKDTRENPKIQRHMGVITKNVAICNHVIRDLYSFTHNPALKLALIKVPDFISSLIIYTKEKVEQYPNIRVESNIETSIPPIMVDEFRLLQAFKNLIDNGFEAMSAEGILSISASYNNIDNNISIEIGDTGCGMTSEELNKIFKPLYSSK
ncbi:PAS domain S-box protein, partial [bacterium]|nr:PAS domain S-box protein [bacterium]